MYANKKQAIGFENLVATNSNVKLSVVKENNFKRLRLAVAEMVTGLEHQKQDVAQTRANIKELDVVMHRIKGGLLNYQRELANIKIRSLRRKSLRLAAICERVQGLATA